MKTIIDTGGVANHTYAYTIIAIDDGGLKSEVPMYSTFHKQAVKNEFKAFSNIEYTIDSINSKVLFTWTPSNDDLLEYVTIYRGPAKDKLGVVEELNYPTASFEQDYNPKKPLYICLVPAYKNYKKFIASEVFEINKIEANE